jgi:hypothetical protein
MIGMIYFLHTTVETCSPEMGRNMSISCEPACTALSAHDVFTGWMARDGTPEGIAAAAVHQTFNFVLQPWEILNFPIVIQRGALLDPKKSKAWGPFVVWVRWRKSSVWLPQAPKIIFSSAKTLRRLDYFSRSIS